MEHVNLTKPCQEKNADYKKVSIYVYLQCGFKNFSNKVFFKEAETYTANILTRATNEKNLNSYTLFFL